MSRILAAAALLVAIAGALVWWTVLRKEGTNSRQTVTLRASRPLTVALTGDTVIARPLPAPGADPGYDAIVAALQSASLAITNLDQNVLESKDARPPERWPVADARSVAALRRAGIGIVSCANNHALDNGLDGLKETRRHLTEAGLLLAGCGEHLAEARRPAVIGDAPHRVAVIAVAVSAPGEYRASQTRGDIKGRPGVAALRYSAQVTADPPTFSAIRELIGLKEGTVPKGDALMWQGTPVKRGTATAVDMIPNEVDLRDLVTLVTETRRTADVVVVTVHSHEPTNRSEQPADLLRQVARLVIDAGARVVIGHGPHQLRGIEAIDGGIAFYSLGDFVFDQKAVSRAVADAYEAGANLYHEILGTSGPAPAAAVARDATETVWWESVLPLVAFTDDGRIDNVRLVPIDLGVDVPLEERGLPRPATGARAVAILERLRRLSGSFNTGIIVEGGVGRVHVQ